MEFVRNPIHFRDNVDFSPAEMIYGTSIRLPSEYFSPSMECPTSVEYVHQLQKFVRDFRPVPTRKFASHPIHVDDELFTYSHVFVRNNGVKVGLQRPYDGPFKVLQRSKKYFKLNLIGKLDNVFIDRLKPADIVDPENFGSSHNTTHANNSENKQTHALGNSSFQFAETNNTVPRDLSPLRITRKSRVIRKPSRYR